MELGGWRHTPPPGGRVPRAEARACGTPRRAVATAALLLAAVLPLALCLAGTAAWGQAPALPGLDRLARPVPDASQAQLSDPNWGFRFGVGVQYLSVTSSELPLALAEGSPFSDGALIVLEAALRTTRLTFARQVYRSPLPPGTSLDGAALTFIGFEADQLWVFQGLNPLPAMYLGAGVGWESRRYSFLVEGGGALARDEVLLKAGLLVEYTFASPFSLQVRATTEEPGHLVRVTGTTLTLAYHFPF